MLRGAGGAVRADGRSRRLHVHVRAGPGAERGEHPGAVPLLDARGRRVRHVAHLLGAQSPTPVHLRQPHRVASREGSPSTKPTHDVLLQDWQASRHLE